MQPMEKDEYCFAYSCNGTYLYCTPKGYAR